MADCIFVGSRYNILIPLKQGMMLAYNSLSGTLALWQQSDKDIYDRIIKNENMDETNETVKQLALGGYIVRKDVDELLNLEQQYRMHRFDRGAMILTVAPTMACNFACDYCFQTKDKPCEEMSSGVQDALVELIKQAAPTINHLHIAWYGGEPMIKLSIIESLSDRIISVCNSHRIKYDSMIVTNGYLLDVDAVKSLCDRGVKTIQVTLDGSPQDHDSRRVLMSGKPTFNRIIENLKQVVDIVPITFSIRINIDYRNSAGINELIDNLHALGFGGKRNFKLYFAPVEAITFDCHGIADVSMSKLDYSQVEAELYWKAFEYGLIQLPYPPRFRGNCGAVRPKGLVLLPNGDIHKCWDTVSTKERRLGTIFNLKDANMIEAANKWLQWTPFENETCRNCKILPNCTGACAYKFIHSQDMAGEAAVLPCISWRYNINERLVLRAVKSGIITTNDYDSGMIKTDVYK